jgi:L-asparagine oxygenase
MWGSTPQAQRLLRTILAVYLKERVAYCLQAGDLVILDNMCAVHGRSPYSAAYDGTDRFLVRSFVTTDLAASRPARPDDSRSISGI